MVAASFYTVTSKRLDAKSLGEVMPKYEVGLTKIEAKEVTTEADTPQAAVAACEADGFLGNYVAEVLDDGEVGQEFAASGHCMACSVVLLDDDYRTDWEGEQFCNKCFKEMVAEEEEMQD